MRTVFCLIVLLKSLDFIYLFQIKEYRFDRFFSSLFEEGLWPIFYFRSIKLPAKTLRNFLILLMVLFSLVFLFSLPVSSQLWLLILFPFVSFLIVSLSVLLTKIPVYFYRQSLINKARLLIRNSLAVFIGITGSYGKTTTKEYLYQILSSRYQVAKTEENMNTDVGVALSVIKNLKKNTQFFIVEMGAYKKGEIKAICDFVKPTLGIITAIGNQHLALFGSQENLIATKKELLEALPSSGRAYVNAETVGFKELTKNLSCEIIPFYPSKTKIEELVAFNLGLSEKEISSVAKGLKPLPKRGSFYQGINNSLVIDDSYNSNVEGFLVMIKRAETIKKQNKIIISRGIIELGKEKEPSYRRILSELNKTRINLYTTDKLFKILDRKNQVKLFKNDEELFKAISEVCNKETLIVIEGKFSQNILRKIILNY